MVRAPLVVFTLLLACGPLVTIDGDGDGSDTDDTGGSTTASTASSSGFDTGSSSVFDEGSGVPPDPSIGDDFPAPVGDCWHAESLFGAPDHVGVLPKDQDSDGREEIWLLWDSDGGQGPGDTTVYAVDAAGVILTEVLISGFVIEIGDIEGNGLHDIVTVSFEEGGPPYFGYAVATGSATFSLPPAMLDLELSQNVSGFFDVSADGLADAFHLRDDGQLELLLGNGSGSFAPATSLALGNVDYAGVTAVEGASSQAVLTIVDDFGGDGCAPVRYALLDGTAGMLTQPTQTDPVLSPNLGFVRRSAIDSVGSAVLYTDSCIPGTESELHDLRQLVAVPGASTFTEIVAAEGKAWVTVGDLDGDALPDLVFADPGAETISIARGTGPQTFARPEYIDVEVADTRDNNVRTVDMDGDGRDELVRGSVIPEGDGMQLSYDRIFLGPC